ncbi:MAG TPA: carboxypeptidase-like regulatory domain-containing protein [Polyangia bacterium]|jgi:hypothetical protein
MALVAAALAAVALGGSACGDDGNQIKAPAARTIARGGVGDGAVKGAINVTVIDAASQDPIPAASVRLGAPSSAAPLTGLTDGTGLVTFLDATLSGAQTVTVTASGYAAATWIGVNGGNVTIPLSRTPAATPNQAVVEGTIQGWDTRPAPADGHMLLAYIFYSSAEPIDQPANKIPQETWTVPGTSLSLPSNLCIKVGTPAISKCAFKLHARVGKQVHYAIIIDVDTNGTLTNLADDTYTVVDYAFLYGVTVVGGQAISGETLVPVGAGGMQTLTVSFAAAPAGQPNLSAVPVIRFGDSGSIVLTTAGFNSAFLSTKVPVLTGELATGTYEIAAAAKASDPGVSVSSLIIDGVTPGTTVNIGGWMTPPTAISASAGTYSFTPAADASFHSVGLTKDGELQWAIAILDGSTSFSLPSLSPSPLPTGQIGMIVEGLRAPGFTATDFSLADVSAATTHLAADGAQVTP